MPVRALIVVRLSRLTDASTSPERQREVCERFCADRGWMVAGIAEDLDVSAGTSSPFDRPSLRPWLVDRLAEYDVIVAYRIDRLVRRVTHLSRMVEWTEEHGKNLASATESVFDLSTPIGKVIANLIASFAEMELEAISERNANAAQYNIRAGKYRGGIAPTGYRSEKDEHGDWRLVPDEVMAPIVREIVARVLEGDRIMTIVADLNRREAPTQRDRQAALQGHEVPKPRKWSGSNLRRILASPQLLGRVVIREPERDANGNARKIKGRKVYGPEQVLLGDDGLPVQRAEPLISESDYRALQRLLAERAEENQQAKRAEESTLLLRVLFCGECGRPMYRLKGGPGREHRYRCASPQYGGACGCRSITIREADQTATDLMMKILGDRPWVVREYDPGEDNTETLAEIDARLETLAESVTRFPAGSAALARLLTEVDALSARRIEIQARPGRVAGYRYVPTGETFREHWDTMIAAERNDYLRDRGVKIDYRHMPGGRPSWEMEFGEMITMLSETDPDLAAVLDASGVAAINDAITSC